MENLVNPGYGYADVSIIPGESDFDISEVQTNTLVTAEGPDLAVPFIASPNPSVCNAKLAESLAESGGIGFIPHTLSIEEQVTQIQQVRAKALLVGASFEINEEDRVKRIVAAGAQVLWLHASNDKRDSVTKVITDIKEQYGVPVVVDRVADASTAETYINAGVDGLVSGWLNWAKPIRAPHVSTIRELSKVAVSARVPIIAPEVTTSGEVVIALAAGANSVCIDALLSGTYESAGRPYRFVHSSLESGVKVLGEGASFKEYRADDTELDDGSVNLMLVDGAVSSRVANILTGVRLGMQFAGTRDLKALHERPRALQVNHASILR